ncbi:MAG: hypothetical protein R3C19_20180 [Planctomycetaceae bacterium]
MPVALAWEEVCHPAAARFSSRLAQGRRQVQSYRIPAWILISQIPAAPGGIAGALSLVALSDPAGINTGIAHIATFSVTITGDAGDTVTIMSDILPITANVVDDGTLLGTPIDADIANFGSLTFTVSAVPEPSTWLGCSLVLVD